MSVRGGGLLPLSRVHEAVVLVVVVGVVLYSFVPTPNRHPTPMNALL